MPLIATAATNGVVLVWDTERVGQSHRVTVGECGCMAVSVCMCVSVAWHGCGLSCV
jgi:hypothetical protein